MRIPRFPIAAVWCDERPRSGGEHWDTRLLALAEGATIRVATAAAARQQVRPGMTLAAARAQCAELEVRPWDAARIGREIARVSALLLTASPQVTPVREAPGTWWIGAGGFTASGERALATTLRALARSWHPRARVAVADSCVASQAATWSARTTTTPLHIPPGDDADFLARVPITLIPMDLELREALVALGLRTAGAFATLDPLEVERRWGVDGLNAWRLARGMDDRRAHLTHTEDPRSVVHELAMSAETLEPVLFIVRAALDRLVQPLVAEGLAATEVAITLTLDDATSALPHTGGGAPTITRVIRSARPVARVAPLFDRCRALLDDWPERQEQRTPIRAVEVRITAVVPSSAEQGDLLAASWRDPATVDGALERLRSAFGPEGVVRPMRHDSHAPERAGQWRGVERLLFPERQEQAVPAIPGTATRLLERPEAIAVALDAQGVPRAVRWRGREFRLASIDGPERLSGEWWQADPFAREYWRCESAEDGRSFLIYRDASGWQLQGWHD